jgi:hypothetical protein
VFDKKKLKRLLRKFGMFTSQEYKHARREVDQGIDYQQQELFSKHNSKLLFIHVPKAAGISVVKKLYNTSSSCHATAKDYRTKNKQKFENAHVVALVRNPYTRLLSAYNYLLDGGRCEIDEVWRERYIAKFKDINEFVQFGLKKAIDDRAEHFIPQTEFLFEDNVLAVDYVGKVENIDEFADHVSKIIGRQIKLNKSSNKSSGSVTLSDLEPQSKQVIKELYKEDFLNFSYIS